jgi:hypothetical protein
MTVILFNIAQELIALVSCYRLKNQLSRACKNTAKNGPHKMPCITGIIMLSIESVSYEEQL